nr:hypothetical protein GCM10025732_10420 [Glycomyces mayteni]
MERIAVPDDYEDRLTAARAALARLPEGPLRDTAARVLDGAPSRDAAGAASDAADRAAAWRRS